MTAEEIQQDEIYAKAYAAAEKSFRKKYERLLFAAKSWMHVYDSAYGEPEECKEYFTLKKLLDEQG